MSNRVVHFEIPSDNPEVSMRFFTEAFGWTFERFGTEDYWMTSTGNEHEPGINGGLMKKKDPRQPVVNSIEVENLETAITKITKAGGNMVVDKMPIPGVGWIAYFMDPDKNIHGIYQNDSSAA